MTTIDHLPQDQRKHFILCACGHYLDMRNLAQVFDHLHDIKPADTQWSYAVRSGEATAYPRSNDRPVGLN